MGKRGAVRISNSGFPVDHSGPGLRVGPTTSATADRKSEACPDGLSLSLKVVQCGSRFLRAECRQFGAKAREAHDFMSATDMTLCVLCFEPVLGCSECEGCDANRYCPGHYYLRAVKKGTLQLGGILDDLGAVADEDEFVQLMNQAVAMGVVQPFTMRARLPGFGR